VGGEFGGREKRCGYGEYGGIRKCWTASGGDPFEGSVPGQVGVACRQVPRSSHGVAVFCRVLLVTLRSVVSVERSLHVVGPVRGSTLRYFASRPIRKTKADRKSSREVLLSFRVLPAHTVARALVWATPSMGFLVPTASSTLGVHNPGLASPGTFRFQVFSTS